MFLQGSLGDRPTERLTDRPCNSVGNDSTKSHPKVIPIFGGSLVSSLIINALTTVTTEDKLTSYISLRTVTFHFMLCSFI